jgi:hypothetical protein
VLCGHPSAPGSWVMRLCDWRRDSSCWLTRRSTAIELPASGFTRRSSFISAVWRREQGGLWPLAFKNWTSVITAGYADAHFRDGSCWLTRRPTASNDTQLPASGLAGFKGER